MPFTEAELSLLRISDRALNEDWKPTGRKRGGIFQPITNEQAREALRLMKSGMSLRAASDRLHMSDVRLRRELKNHINKENQ